MHPAFSVLFFTVTSGMGFGLLFCLILAYHSGAYPFALESLKAGSLWSRLAQPYVYDLAIAAIICTLGLVSSSFHLANPKNAWRSFTRFRSSWLSREAVFAVLIYPVLSMYVLMLCYGFSLTAQVLALCLIILLVALVYCTAMIYASLKTIPQWHNRWVTPGFLLYSLVSGLIAYTAIVPAAPLSAWWYVPVLLSGLALKLVYYRSLGQPEISNINTATGFGRASQASITLFDTGHSSRNFAQREFMYTVGPKTVGLARKTGLLAAFILPAALLLAGWAWVALVTHYVGMLLERWLFFVEAKHVIRHYYAS